MTNILETPTQWKTLQRTFDNASIGFVPTMGNLHAGHESLLTQAKAENLITVLSIFTNPTQFDDPNDFNHYPKSLEEDIAKAKKLDIDWVFIPTVEDLYPDKYHYRVMETELSDLFCGKFRPGHFIGMLTVVLKLLSLINPTRAYFGEKDFQQLELVKGMAQAFFLNVEIIACKTVRDANGLALSSRNQRLSEKEYQLATTFPKLLNTTLTKEEITQKLTELGFIVDYIEEWKGRRLGAVKLGDIRLIDNVPLQNNF